MESVVTLSMLIRRFEFELVIKPEDVGFYTGATIHTRNGLPMRVRRRVLTDSDAGEGGAVISDQSAPATESVTANSTGIPVYK